MKMTTKCENKQNIILLSKLFINNKPTVNLLSPLYRKYILSCLILTVSSNIWAAEYEVVAGQITDIGVKDNWSVSIRTNDWKAYHSMGANLFGFVTRSPVSPLCVNYGQFETDGAIYDVTTIDGYSGIKVANGIILVPMNLNASGTGTFAAYGQANNLKTYNTTVTTDSKGIRTGLGVNSDPVRWCSTLQNISDEYTWVIDGTRTGSGSVNWGVYVASSVASGTYTLPDIYVGLNYINGDNTASYKISNLKGNTIRIRQPLKCTIVAPSPINFKTVNVNTVQNNDVLDSYSGELTLNCDGEGTPKASISVTGEKGRDTDALKMKWVDSTITSETPAEIKGFIGNPLPSGECKGKNSGYSNYIEFDPSVNQKISIGNLSPAQHMIPYSFSLCAKGNQSGGDAHASATINVNWD